VTFTARVTANAPGSGTPTGTVDFFDTTTNTDLTPGGVTLSSGTASFSTTDLTPGSHAIEATYSGSTNFLTSSASNVTVTIGQSIIVLDPSASAALNLSGNASINISGGVYVDSGSSSALSATGNAMVKAAVIDVHGKVQKSGDASFSPAPVTGAAVMADPFASLPLPSTSGLTNYGSESLSGNSSATIKPGIYSAITVSGNAKLTFSSGVYIIEGGGLSVSGNASISGSGVLIVNAGSKYPNSGGSYGSISLSGNGSYNLTPETSGTYAGIVILQTRDNSEAMTISGNASGMTGTIYAPATQLTESGNASLDAALVVDTLTISGNGVADVVTSGSPSATVAYGIGALSPVGTGQMIGGGASDDAGTFRAFAAPLAPLAPTGPDPALYAQGAPASTPQTALNLYGQSASPSGIDPNSTGMDNRESGEDLDVESARAILRGAQILLASSVSPLAPVTTILIGQPALPQSAAGRVDAGLARSVILRAIGVDDGSGAVPISPRRERLPEMLLDELIADPVLAHSRELDRLIDVRASSLADNGPVRAGRGQVVPDVLPLGAVPAGPLSRREATRQSAGIGGIVLAAGLCGFGAGLRAARSSADARGAPPSPRTRRRG
jgi:Bacterial Ig-like domain (group 3)